jgi:environmental stress-induced protein Ves
MKLIRYSDLSVLAWKNGLGVRRDIAHGRYQTDDIDTSWLVSISDLNENALFSIYPGTRRWFLPITKGWVTLNFDIGGIIMPVEMSEDSPAHEFSGDATVHCLLHDGPMKALNVMANADDVVVKITKTKLSDKGIFSLSSSPNGNISILTVTSGVCRVNSDAWSGPVATWNSLVNDSGQSESFEVSPVQSAEIVITTIKLIGDPSRTQRKLAQVTE